MIINVHIEVTKKELPDVLSFLHNRAVVSMPVKDCRYDHAKDRLEKVVNQIMIERLTKNPFGDIMLE